MSKTKPTLLLDVSLLFAIVLIIGTTIFISLGTNPFFFDLICLLITVMLMIITYFTGIVSGLTFTLIFIFAQLAYVIYQYLYHDIFSYGSVFWLILPPLLCLNIFIVTYQIRLIQDENTALRISTTRLNTLDADTNLRTLKMYEEDFNMFSDVSNRFNAPLYTVVIRVSYWESMRNLMSNEQIKELLKLVTATIQETTDECNLLYIVDHSVPTWSLLIFTDQNKLKMLKELVKEKFKEKLNYSAELNEINISLVFAYVQYNQEEFSSATELLGDGINALQYDV